MCQSTAIYPSFFLFTFNKLTILTIQIKNIQWRQISYIFKMETLHMRASCYMDLFAIIYRMELEFYVKNKSKEKRVFSLYAWCSFCIQALDLGACSTVTALRQICTPYDHNSWLESLQGLGIVCLFASEFFTLNSPDSHDCGQPVCLLPMCCSRQQKSLSHKKDILLLLFSVKCTTKLVFIWSIWHLERFYLADQPDPALSSSQQALFW